MTLTMREFDWEGGHLRDMTLLEGPPRGNFDEVSESDGETACTASVFTVDTNKAVIEKSPGIFAKLSKLTAIALVVHLAKKIRELRSNGEQHKLSRSSRRSFWTRVLQLSRTLKRITPAVASTKTRAHNTQENDDTFNLISDSDVEENLISDSVIRGPGTHLPENSAKNRGSRLSSKKNDSATSPMRKYNTAPPSPLFSFPTKASREERFSVDDIYEEVRRRNREIATLKKQGYFDFDSEPSEEDSMVSDGSVTSYWNPVPKL